MRVALLGAVLSTCALAALACVREQDSAFELRLRRGASCSDVPIDCARVLNVALDHEAEAKSWRLLITGTGAGARFGDLDLPTSGSGRFFVQGSSLGLGPVFAGTSGTVLFDARDAAADVTYECVLPPPCATFTPPIATPTPFVAAADLVLGQADFTTCNGDGLPDRSYTLQEPDGIERAEGKLWVADADNNRAAVWSTAGLVSGKRIDFVVQQGNRTDNADGDGANDSRLPRDIVIAPAIPLRLLVDTGVGDNTRGNRVGRNTTIPTSDAASPNNDPYETVLGQDAVGGGTTDVNRGGLGAGSLSMPWSALVTGTSLWVADTGNHRVLRYALADVAAGNQPAANLVLGQPDFTSNAPASGAGMSSPRHLATDGTRLYVADSGNHRVLVFEGLDALTNGAPASVVIGQTSLEGNAAGSGTAGLNAPRGVAADATRVVIADSGNHRVLVFAPPPTTHGAAAVQVLGQIDFTGTTPNHDGAAGTCPDAGTCGGVGETNRPTATSLARPGAVWIEGATLWVSDTCNSRVLRYREVVAATLLSDRTVGQ